MLALLGNFDFTELLVVAAGALMVFGKRLPEVAMRAAAHLVRLRRTVQQMWRQSGLEDELRKVRREVERELSDHPAASALHGPPPARRTPATRTQHGTLAHGLDPAGIEAQARKTGTPRFPAPAGTSTAGEPGATDEAAPRPGPDPEPRPPATGDVGQPPKAPAEAEPAADDEPSSADPDGRDPSDRESA